MSIAQRDPRVAIVRGVASYAGASAAVHRAIAAALDIPVNGTQPNPLEAIVRPGDTVVVKPNFVRDFRESAPDDGDCLFTHGSVIRAVLELAAEALHGRGRLIVADAPQNDADFGVIAGLTDLAATCEAVGARFGVGVEVIDLRPEAAVKKDGVIVGHRPLPGDPAGYVRVDLGQRSAFAAIEGRCDRLYGAEYDRHELLEHHRDGRHEYLLSRTVLQANCVLNVPKLKTHKKAGLTAALKNLVGINGNKNWLPHHREGTPRTGGDQFADERLLRHAERGVMSVFRRVFPMLGPVRPALARPLKATGRFVFGDTNISTVRSGNWHGNDTTWRMVLDLNRALMYAGADGLLADRPARHLFTIVDGIVAGEGNGPLDATPRHAGWIIAGANPVAVDLVCARLIGFNDRRLPILTRALEPHPLPLVTFGADDVLVASGDGGDEVPLALLQSAEPPFRPHFGWAGHVERQESPDAELTVT